MRIERPIEHVSLREALPEPSEVTPPAPREERTSEAMRLCPIETSALGPSPWRAVSDRAAPGEALFASLHRRAEDARRASHVAGGMQRELEAQLGAVLAMTARLAELETLSATVSKERGRWLRV
jgi:hypothetical protein